MTTMNDLERRVADLEKALEAAIRKLDQLQVKVETAIARSKALGG